MALVIYDQGYRIQTPVRALFKPGGVETLEQIKATHTVAGKEQQAEADAERLLLPGSSARHQRTSKPQREQRSQDRPTAGGYVPTDARRRRQAVTLPASQIMSAPVHQIRHNATVGEAHERMRNLDIEHLVVVSEQQRPLGMISARDLEKSNLKAQAPLASAYSGHLIAASPDTNVAQLAANFVEYRISALPIVDNNDKLVGIVTRTDLLRLLITGAHIEGWA